MFIAELKNSNNRHRLFTEKLNEMGVYKIPDELKSGKLLSHNSSGILYTPIPLSFLVKSLCRLLVFFNSAINLSRQTSKPNPKNRLDNL